MKYIGLNNIDRAIFAKDVVADGFKKSVDKVLRKSNGSKSEFIFSELSMRHTAWIGLINKEKIKHVIVIETGIGAGVEALSHFVEHVYALYLDDGTKDIVKGRIKSKNVQHFLIEEFPGIKNVHGSSSLALLYNDTNDYNVIRHFIRIMSLNNIAYYYYAGLCGFSNITSKIKSLANDCTVYHIEGSIRDPYKMVARSNKIKYLGLFKYLVYDLVTKFRKDSFVISNLDIDDSFFNSVCSDILKDQRYEIEHIFFIKPSGALLVVKTSENKYMFRLTSDMLGIKRLSINNVALKSLKSHGVDCVPVLYHEKTFGSYQCSVEQCLDGNNISPQEICDEKVLKSIYKQATKLLIGFQLKTQTEKKFTESLYQDLIAKPIFDAKELFSDEYKSVFSAIDDYFREIYVDRSCLLALTHGDYSADNIMIKNGLITGVIDWEYSKELGLPLVDLLFLICNIHKKKNNISIISAMEEVILSKNVSMIESDCINLYCNQLNISESLRMSLGIMCIINFIAYRLEINYSIDREKYFEENFRDILQSINIEVRK